MHYFNATADPSFVAFKKKAFADIVKVKSKLPEMQKLGSVKILELGVGTGTNFQFYPQECHLVVVDPNPHFAKYYNENRSKFPQIKSEEIIVSTGEEMNMVADESVDVVVISLVLCSVGDTKQILKQVLRVLVPGGKFFFIEHIREWDSEKHRGRQICQDLLTMTWVWPTLFDGCELNRETLKHIEAAGFSDVKAQKLYAPIDHPLFKIVNSQLLGYATK